MIEFGNITVFTAEEVAERLSISAARIRSLIKQGQLTARRVGRTYFITEKKLEEFLECGTAVQKAPHPASEDVTHDISRIDAILGKNKNSQRKNDKH